MIYSQEFLPIKKERNEIFIIISGFLMPINWNLYGEEEITEYLVKMGYRVVRFDWDNISFRSESKSKMKLRQHFYRNYYNQVLDIIDLYKNGDRLNFISFSFGSNIALELMGQFNINKNIMISPTIGRRMIGSLKYNYKNVDGLKKYYKTFYWKLIEKNWDKHMKIVDSIKIDNSNLIIGTEENIAIINWSKKQKNVTYCYGANHIFKDKNKELLLEIKRIIENK